MCDINCTYYWLLVPGLLLLVDSTLLAECFHTIGSNPRIQIQEKSTICVESQVIEGGCWEKVTS